MLLFWHEKALEKFCQKLKNESKDRETNKEDSIDNCLATVTTEDLVTILDAGLISIACDESSWIVDIGAASHVTLRKDFLFLYSW